MQLEAIASHPITSYLGEEMNTCLTTTSFQVVVESNKVGLLGCKRTLLAHVQLFTHQHPQVLLSRAAPNPFMPWPVSILGIARPMCRTLHLALLNLMRFTQAHFSSL